MTRGEHDQVKRLYRFVGAALAGAAIVMVALWLSESIVPQVLSLPLETNSLTILLVVFVGGGLVAWRGRIFEAAALLAGAGAAWAFHARLQLIACQSDALYRPCTASEVGWMAIPAVVLLASGSVLLASVLARTRPTP